MVRSTILRVYSTQTETLFARRTVLADRLGGQLVVLPNRTENVVGRTLRTLAARRTLEVLGFFRGDLVIFRTVVS